MASLFTRSTGSKEIQFVDSEGKRQSICLGKCSKRAAEKTKGVVEDLISSRRLDESPKDSSRQWLKEIDVKLHAKLTAWGLAECREIARLETFVDRYIEGRSDAKEPTKRKFRVTKGYLVKHFGADRQMGSITEGHAEDFRIFLLEQKVSGEDTMSENTVRKHCQIAGQFFNRAKKLRLIEDNPFEALPSTVQPNPERFAYIDQETIEKVIAKAPDIQWKMIFALARYAGLRCPSEILELRWGDILWDDQDMIVRSPKTQHHIGKSQRVVPIFADLLPILREGFELAEEGSEFLITRYRSSSTNLRTQAHKIIRRAGTEPWQKVFQNLRSSLATDLVQHEPIHTVAEWTGHSVETMRKFYLQITKEHRELAKLRERRRKEDPQQNPQQSLRDAGGQRGTADSESPVKSDPDLNRLIDVMGVEGLEPPTLSV